MQILLAASYIQQSAVEAGSAASAASERKSAKYSNVAASHMFYPVAVETLGVLADEAHEFISETGRRASLSTADPRETTFLYQRISLHGNTLHTLLNVSHPGNEVWV